MENPARAEWAGGDRTAAPDDGLWMLLFVNHLLWIEAGLIDQGLTLL